MARGEAAKKTITAEQWEAKLNAVQVSKQDMNRLVMDFLVSEGYVDAAAAFEAESGTPPGVPLESVVGRMEVRRAVQRGDVVAAIERVNDLDPEILEARPALFFHLQQQRLIELIRGGDVGGALAFAQEYLAPQGEEHPAFLEELERTVALLAFEDASSSPVGELMQPAQRHKTASELNAALLAAQCRDPEPRLPLLLKLLLWAQAQLEERARFPHVCDLSTAQLAPPSAD